MLPVAPVTRNVSMLDFVSFIWCEVGIHLTQLNLTRCVCRGRFSDRRTIISYVAVAAFTACCTNLPHPARSPSFPARRGLARLSIRTGQEACPTAPLLPLCHSLPDRKSTRLNSSHLVISY